VLNPQAWDEISKDYLGNIVSPFDEGTSNPLFDLLRSVADARKKTIGDLGCGVGPLVPFLSQRFGRVVAIDFSEGMLRRARRAAKSDNVTFHCVDMTDLSAFRATFHVAVAVNSVIVPSLRRVNRILRQIALSLRPGGTFVGVFPAMDSILYYAMLVVERENSGAASESTAIQRSKRLCERHKYDFMLGLFKDDDGGRQKHYYRFELRHRLHKAGFVNLRFRKVRYPWDKSVSGFDCFPGKPKLWDWLVRAERASA